ncbi:MAG: hypothetical protein IPF55_11745 [Rhodoferax sp.]|nr:hypothetical protein [Rhodoferax sp.]
MTACTLVVSALSVLRQRRVSAPDLLAIACIDPDGRLQPVCVTQANHVTQSVEGSHGGA